MKVALIIMSLNFWYQVWARANKDVVKYLPKEPCDTIHVLASPSQGTYLLLLKENFMHYELPFSSERKEASSLSGLSGEDAIVMWFGSVGKLLGIKDDKTLATVLTSSSCLSVIAQSTKVEDISNLVDLVSNIRVKNKYLVVQTPPLNTTLLQSKKINFNVMVNEVKSGMKQLV